MDWGVRNLLFLINDFVFHIPNLARACCLVFCVMIWTAGAFKLNTGMADVVVNWAGGLHHAKKRYSRHVCVCVCVCVLAHHPA
jgi:hypothetical protein